MEKAEVVSLVRGYLKAIEKGDAAAMLACYALEAVQLELPNRLKPQGDRRGLDKMSADFARGKGLLVEQRYDVEDVVVDGDRAVARFTWRGVLAVPLGALKAGDAMISHSAVAFRFRAGRIVEQHNYDCFEPF